MSTKYTDMKYICSSCNRGYNRKIYYSRHVAVCEIMCKSVKERKLENEERDDTPDVRVLYDVILELVNKMSIMERKMNDMSKWYELKKKKINIVDWLNENEVVPSPFEEFIKRIKIGRKYLDYLFKNDYIICIINIIQDLLPLDQSEKNTIKAFEQKNNTLFVYTKEKWIIMSDEILQKLVNIIEKQLLDEFVKWQIENKDKMKEDDFAIKYATNVKKIMGGNLTREQVYSRVKLDLYKYLKVNIKNITEIQFD